MCSRQTILMPKQETQGFEPKNFTFEGMKYLKVVALVGLKPKFFRWKEFLLSSCWVTKNIHWQDFKTYLRKYYHWGIGWGMNFNTQLKKICNFSFWIFVEEQQVRFIERIHLIHIKIFVAVFIMHRLFKFMETMWPNSKFQSGNFLNF